MTSFAIGPPVLTGVEAVLRAVTEQAVGVLHTRDAHGEQVQVTFGPLDRPVVAPRLNWFLYRIMPAPAYLNMEHPTTGWTTRRGRPPLALSLHYLLSAEPGNLSTDNETNESLVHAALTAVMNILHNHAIFGLSTPVAATADGTVTTVQQVTSALNGMVEPLRVTMAPVPIETITALWTTGSRAIRLSVGYEVSLVTVPADSPFVSGPPVLERVLGIGPSTGPVITAVVPPTLWFGSTSTIRATALVEDVTVTLSRLPGDPDDPADHRPNPTTTHSTKPWTLTTAPVSDGVAVSLPGPGLVPGTRTVTVTNWVNSLPAGSAQAALTVVPAVERPITALRPGQLAHLSADHVTTAGQVFFGGLGTSFTVTAPATLSTRADVACTVPAQLATGVTVPVSLQVGPLTGPAHDLAVVP